MSDGPRWQAFILFVLYLALNLNNAIVTHIYIDIYFYIYLPIHTINKTKTETKEVKDTCLSVINLLENQII